MKKRRPAEGKKSASFGWESANKMRGSLKKRGSLTYEKTKGSIKKKQGVVGERLPGKRGN